jgi:hypothetical protein
LKKEIIGYDDQDNTSLWAIRKALSTPSKELEELICKFQFETEEQKFTAMEWAKYYKRLFCEYWIDSQIDK